MKNALKPLAESVLISLELTATASSTHAAFQKKNKKKKQKREGGKGFGYDDINNFEQINEGYHENS